MDNNETLNNQNESTNGKTNKQTEANNFEEFKKSMDEFSRRRSEILERIKRSHEEKAVDETKDIITDKQQTDSQNNIANTSSQADENEDQEPQKNAFDNAENQPSTKAEDAVLIEDNVDAIRYDYVPQEEQNNKKIKKKREKSFKNTYIYGFLFIIFSILFEIANFLRLGLGAIPVNFGIELAMIIMVAGIIFIIPTEPLKISVASIFLGVQMIMNIANASLYNMMYDIITVDMIFTLGFETMDAFELNQLDLTALIMNVSLVVVYVVCIALGSKFMPRFRLRKDKRAIVALITLLLSVEMIGFGSLKVSQNIYFANANAEYIMEDGDYLYTTMSAKMASLKKYGFWCFYLNNCNIFFNYQKEIGKKALRELKEYIEDEDAKGFAYQNSMFNGENVSGALAGQNLIMIMMESIEWFAIDPYNTPDLYQFVNTDAIKFNNYYSRNKTNISEEISILGSVVNDYSFTTIKDNVGLSASHSLPNLFKDNGYGSVNFFHDYTGKMYDRDTLNKEMGFTNVFTMENCSIEDKPKYFGDFWDDGDFVEAYASEMMPTNQQFFSYFTTVTTHGPYENHNNRLDEHGYYERFDENYNDYCQYVRTNNLNFATPNIGTHEYNILRDYKAKAMAVDNAIHVIRSYLATHYTNGDTTKPLSDNTSIVIFADHNAYYSNLCYLVKGTNKFANDKENYRVPFAIYNKNLGGGEVDTFCNTYDIVPTICDLYGFEYNKNLTQGYSVFSDEIENSLFVSTMVGMFDEKFFTVTLDEYTAIDDTLETNSKLVKFKTNLDRFLTKQKFIETYYRINYEEYVLTH